MAWNTVTIMTRGEKISWINIHLKKETFLEVQFVLSQNKYQYRFT
jgi:hypothetical protein